MVDEVLGELQYYLTDGKYRPKVSINDIKAFKIPNTDHWRINNQFLKSCLTDLGIDQRMKPIVQMHRVEEILSRKLYGRRPPTNLIMVVPEWTCCAWYKELMQCKQRIQWFKLPGREDDFTDKQGRALGKLAWNNWLVVFNPK